MAQGLIGAVIDSRVDRVQELIAEGADPQALDSSDRSYGPHQVCGIAALHAAFQRGVDPAVADYLLSLPCLDWNLRDANGQTPLHVVLDRWHGPARAQYMRRLLVAGSDPNAADQFGRTPLWELPSFYRLDDEIELFEELVAAGADPGLHVGGETLVDHVWNSVARHFHEYNDKKGQVRLAKYLFDAGYPAAGYARRGLEVWLAERVPKYLDGKVSQPEPPTSAQQRFAAVTGGALVPLLMVDAYLSIDGEPEPVALFDWFALVAGEDNDEHDLASQVWDYHIPPDGPVFEAVEREDLVPFGVVGMTGSMDSFEEMGVDGTLFLDLAASTGGPSPDAPVMYVRGEGGDGQPRRLGDYRALIATLATDPISSALPR